MTTNPRYNSFERNSYHFRKRLPHRHLLEYDYDPMYRISLRKVAKSYYYILEKDIDKLNELTKYINTRLLIFLELKGTVVLNEISEFIYKICDDYQAEAIIENSSTEIKRVDALEYTDQNGVQAGHTIQALSRAYKKVSDQYNKLTTNTEQTYALGSEIVKRSNITKEQLLKIPENKRLEFYEMLIKAEKHILEQDIKLYIQRNLHQFSSLITDFEASEKQQAGRVYAEYLNIVLDNKPQINYLQFIKKVNPSSNLSTINQENMIESILATMKIKEEDKLLNVSTNINNLIEQFIEYKNFTDKRRKSAIIAISYFANFLEGNGKEYKSKNLEDLFMSDILEFQKLMIECTPKNKTSAQKTLFEMIGIRLENNYARYSFNSMKGMQAHIKQFWKYLSKYHKNLGLDADVMDAFNPATLLASTKSDEGESDPALRAFTIDEINLFIDTAFSKERIRKTLLNSPHHFYVFMFSFLAGTRLEESLLISMNDIKVQIKNNKNYYYIHLKEDQAYQHLKNPNAHRNIPITDLMIKFGILNHINRRHQANKLTLFDFPVSSSASISIYYRRHFIKLFPEFCDTRNNRNAKLQNNIIHFRSLRKNFSNILFSENRSQYDTETNKKMLFGHSNGITGIYLGRLEPYIGFNIMNNIEYEDFHINQLSQNMKNFCDEIIYDLEWLEQGSTEEWKTISTVRARRSTSI